MAKKLVNMRLDEELLALADELAESRRSRTAVMEEALRLLWEHERSGAVEEPAPPVRAAVPRIEGVRSASDLLAGKLYRCPERSCAFAAPSPRATCRIHGRRVVEA